MELMEESNREQALLGLVRILSPGSFYKVDLKPFDNPLFAWVGRYFSI